MACFQVVGKEIDRLGKQRAAGVIFQVVQIDTLDEDVVSPPTLALHRDLYPGLQRLPAPRSARS